MSALVKDESGRPELKINAGKMHEISSIPGDRWIRAILSYFTPCEEGLARTVRLRLIHGDSGEFVSHFNLTPVCSPKCSLGSRRTKMPRTAPSYKRGGPRKRRSDGEDWIMGQPLTRFCARWNPERRRCRRRIGSRARLKAPGTLGGIEVVPGWLEKLEGCWGSNPSLRVY
jgi:hypothetical protein